MVLFIYYYFETQFKLRTIFFFSKLRALFKNNMITYSCNHEKQDIFQGLAYRCLFLASALINASSSRGNPIGCEPRIIKRKSQVRIPPPPIFAWTCQKK
jgi:hypothetical protein